MIGRGYDWDAGKSVNAVDAVERGMLTGSQIAKLAGKDVKVVDVQTALRYGEWHHTSSKFNKTRYYEAPTDEQLEAVRQAAATRLSKAPTTMRLKSWTWHKSYVGAYGRKQFSQVWVDHGLCTVHEWPNDPEAKVKITTESGETIQRKRRYFEEAR